MNFNPEYIILLEDDGVPADHMLNVLQNILQRLKDSKDTYRQPWSLIKLFYPDRWQGYGFESQKILELCSAGSLGGILFLAMYSYSAKFRLPTKYYRKMNLLVFSVGFLFVVASCIMIGRPNLIHIKTLSIYTYSTSKAPECCSPGILYPAEIVTMLNRHLNNTVCHHNYPLDMALTAFTNNLAYPSYIVQPNLVKHIGMISTLKGVSKYPWEFIV